MDRAARPSRFHHYGNRQKDTSEVVEGQQQQQHAVKRDVKDILIDTRRVTAQTIEMGEETEKKLEMQGEQMARTNDSLDRIEHNLRVSDRIVKSMSSLGGMVSTFFTSAPKPPKATGAARKQPPPPPPPADGAQTGDGGGFLGFLGFGKRKAAPPPQQQQSKVAIGGMTAEEDKLLDGIAFDVEQLKAQAVRTSSLLDQQNKTLDEMSAKTDHVSGHVKRTVRNIKKVT